MKAKINDKDRLYNTIYFVKEALKELKYRNYGLVKELLDDAVDESKKV